MGSEESQVLQEIAKLEIPQEVREGLEGLAGKAAAGNFWGDLLGFLVSQGSFPDKPVALDIVAKRMGTEGKRLATSANAADTLSFMLERMGELGVLGDPQAWAELMASELAVVILTLQAARKSGVVEAEEVAERVVVRFPEMESVVREALSVELKDVNFELELEYGH